MADERNPPIEETEPGAGLVPNLTTDEPGTVGDAMPPISADLPEAGGLDHGDGTSGSVSSPVSSTNQAKPEPVPPTPAGEEHFADNPASGRLPRTGEPYPAEDGPVGRATPPDTPVMAGAPSSNDAVRPAVAVPGKPDGEVDTRT